MDRFGASVEARYLQAARPRRRGARGRLPRRVRRRPRRRHPARAGRRARRPAARASGSCACARGRAPRAMDGIRETLERFGVRVRRLLLRGDARGARRDRRRRSSACARADTLRGRRRDRGSAPPTSATTRTASLVRSNGTHTYFGADCAYLIDKFASRVRPPDLRVGRRPPRRRRAGEGRRGGARVRPGPASRS